ncbi:hypothetical protein ENBRE01_2920 [Enteropsectra breve]|nr:hypothetical protein ENBRE01_2920 [Enteropsectra breve]
MQIIYMHCLEIKVRYITSELNVSEQAVYSIANIFYKKIDEDDYNYTFDKLGGPDAIIEVDETHIVFRKDNRGRILAGERYWIIGAICRETKNIVLQVVRRRTSVISSNFVDPDDPTIHTQNIERFWNPLKKNTLILIILIIYVKQINVSQSRKISL